MSTLASERIWAWIGRYMYAGEVVRQHTTQCTSFILSSSTASSHPHPPPILPSPRFESGSDSAYVTDDSERESGLMLLLNPFTGELLSNIICRTCSCVVDHQSSLAAVSSFPDFVCLLLPMRLKFQSRASALFMDVSERALRVKAESSREVECPKVEIGIIQLVHEIGHMDIRSCHGQTPSLLNESSDDRKSPWTA